LKLIIDFRMYNASGIGTYITNIVPFLIDKFDVILLGKVNEINFFYKKAKVIECNSSIYSIQEQFELFNKIPKCDIFWSPHYNIPIFPIKAKKIIVTVHDVFHLAMLEYVEGIHKRLYAKALFTAIKYKANKIICVSKFSAKELVRLTGVNPDKITVIHNGVNKEWFEIKKEKRPHNKPYLLYVGNVKPHKNLVRLLEAFELLANKIPHDLIIVGKKEGFITGDTIIEKKAISLKQRVHFTGYVDNKLLHQYFVHAETLVFPSLYEGFGLPPLEAMACGCPVIVSNAASLPEVCGDAAIYCDPYSVEDIANKIEQLLADKNLQQEMRLKGIERAKQFSWEKAAKKTCEVIEELIK
jgi:glycosyltransferase involved in cell wall biosynthesis